MTEAQVRYIIRALIKEEREKLRQALLQEEGVRIVNAVGTSGDHIDNKTPWRAFWEKKTGKKLEDLLPQKNGKFLCPGHTHHTNDDGYVDEKDICGCHVKKSDANGKIIDNTMYITPMCKGCNKRNDVFKVGDRALVKRYKSKYTFHEKHK